MILKKNFILTFILCSLFSFNTFGVGGVLDDISELFLRGAKSSNETIQREFDRTLDEVLEITEMNRADIPEYILDNLRNVTGHPVRLIDPDSPYRINTSMFFRPGHDKRITNLYRAFLQKSVNPENREQMNHLASIVDIFFDTLNSPAQVETLSRKDILFDLFIHRGVITPAGFPTPEFQVWIDELHKTLYQKETFEEAAKKAFEKGQFDRKAFFEIWKDEAFRNFIVESRFMTKTHLTGNTDLLIRWSDELEKQGDLRQLSVLIEDSYRKAHDVYNVDEVIKRDDFWNTVLKASREDANFDNRVKRILQDIISGREGRTQRIRHMEFPMESGISDGGLPF